MERTELDEFVNKVRERSDLVSVVSRYVPLTKKSGSYWGRCPFHNEKTPSFSVNPDKGFFYCFGCHAGGNVFKFLSLIENLTYFEAIKLQAERLGIPLPSRKKSSEEIRREREKRELLKINELTRDFYLDELAKTPEGESGRKYLAGRGITDATIEEFKIGFAPDTWNKLTDFLLNRGFSPDDLTKTGVAVKRKDGSGILDRFRGRVMIPIADIFGHVVGFGGRILKAEDEYNPKYLNSPETPVFNKRQILFGLDKAHLSISSSGFAIVVEGYMDAISLVGAGIRNVVATLGTAFTPDHAKLIMRYARKIVFCYDSDEAGQRATVRALPIVKNAGAEVSVVQVPDGKDPDEFVRKHGRDAFVKLLKNAVPLVEYRMNYVLSHMKISTLAEKISALREILPTVVGVEDATLKAGYRKQLSSALMLDESTISREWDAFLRGNSVKSGVYPDSSKIPPKKSDNVARKKLPVGLSSTGVAEEIILRMAWHEPDVLGYVMSLVPKEVFSGVHAEIVKYLEKCIEEEKRPDAIDAGAELTDEANAELSRILIGGSEEPRDTELAAFEDSMKVLRIEWLQIRYNLVTQEADKIFREDYDAYAKKIAESLKIKEEMNKLRFETAKKINL